jgi:hypothetical protein
MFSKGALMVLRNALALGAIALSSVAVPAAAASFYFDTEIAPPARVEVVPETRTYVVPDTRTYVDRYVVESPTYSYHEAPSRVYIERY